MEGQVFFGPRYWMPVVADTSNPTASTVRYFGNWSSAPTPTVQALCNFIPSPGDSYISAVNVSLIVGGTLASGEVGSISLLIQGTTAYTITAAALWNAARADYSRVFAPGEISTRKPMTFEIQVNYPAWVTAPTLVIYSGGIWMDTLPSMQD